MGNDGKYDERMQRMAVAARYAEADAKAIPDHIFAVVRHSQRLDYSYGDPEELTEMEEIREELHKAEQRLLALTIRLKARFGW